MRASILAACLILGLVGGCSDAATEGDGCDAVVWGKPQRTGKALALVGSWNDWGASTSMQRFADDPSWQLAQLRLPPGEYGYLIVEEGRGRLDRYDGLTTFRDSDEQEVSLLRVAACDVPRVSVVSAMPIDGPTMQLQLSVAPAQDEAAVRRFDVAGAKVSGDLDSGPFDGTVALAVTPPFVPGEPGKWHAEVTFIDDEERHSDALDVALWADPVAPRWSDGIIYQVMIDRFRGDGGVVLDPPPTPGSRAGGTLTGVTAAMRDGYFDALGVSALWLSPVYANPEEAREGLDGHMYEAYHGYWPAKPRVVDARIGGDAALHELVAEAHARGIRVLLDLVPNHVYEDHPIVAEGLAKGWFNVPADGSECVCGTPTCPWSKYILTCWFASYLPDFHFENHDAMNWVVADAVWWQQTFDTDGFRIDAVPMMPRAATRRIVAALREATAPRDAAFSIGEIFTGGGRFGTEDLRYYLGPDGLDSAFDFPLMWSLRDAITGEGSFADVEAGLDNTDDVLAGSGAESQLGRMIGNHDVTRFASEAAGDAGRDPWDDPPPQSADPEVYARQRLALGLVLTLPGLPVVYYGDEVALAGASDPDNRRVMPDPAALSSRQSALLDDVRTLARTRRCVAALRGGTRHALVAGDTHYAFVRDAGDGRPALVVASRAATPTTLDLDLPAPLSDGTYDDALGGPTLTIAGAHATVALPPFGLAVFLPGPACG